MLPPTGVILDPPHPWGQPPSGQGRTCRNPLIKVDLPEQSCGFKRWVETDKQGRAGRQMPGQKAKRCLGIFQRGLTYPSPPRFPSDLPAAPQPKLLDWAQDFGLQNPHGSSNVERLLTMAT